MVSTPIPCQYGGGNEYHCDKQPCMICPGPINQRQGITNKQVNAIVEQAHDVADFVEALQIKLDGKAT